MKKIIALLFFISTSVWSQTEAWYAQFSKANALYEQEKYNEAIEGYLALESDGAQSEELFFNLGNAYYKLQQTAPAIYYYEKALLLNPNNQSTLTNLKFAEKTLLGEVTKIEKIETKDIIHGIFKYYTYNQWAWITTGFAFLIFVCFAVYYLISSALIKRFLFMGIFTLILFALISVFGAYSEKKYENNHRPGIVFKNNATLKEDAKNSSKTKEELREGTKVFIIEEKGLWSKVKLENQEIGWLQKEDFRAVK